MSPHQPKWIVRHANSDTYHPKVEEVNETWERTWSLRGIGLRVRACGPGRQGSIEAIRQQADPVAVREDRGEFPQGYSPACRVGVALVEVGEDGVLPVQHLHVPRCHVFLLRAARHMQYSCSSSQQRRMEKSHHHKDISLGRTLLWGQAVQGGGMYDLQAPFQWPRVLCVMKVREHVPDMGKLFASKLACIIAGHPFRGETTLSPSIELLIIN